MSGEKSWGWVLEEVEKLRLLEDDWNGDGAVAPTADVFDQAVFNVAVLEAAGYRVPDRVIPSVNGTILFEYSGDSDLDIEIE